MTETLVQPLLLRKNISKKTIIQPKFSRNYNFASSSYSNGYRCHHSSFMKIQTVTPANTTLNQSFFWRIVKRWRYRLWSVWKFHIGEQKSKHRKHRFRSECSSKLIQLAKLLLTTYLILFHMHRIYTLFTNLITNQLIATYIRWMVYRMIQLLFYKKRN